MPTTGADRGGLRRLLAPLLSSSRRRHQGVGRIGAGAGEAKQQRKSCSTAVESWGLSTGAEAGQAKRRPFAATSMLGASVFGCLSRASSSESLHRGRPMEACSSWARPARPKSSPSLIRFSPLSSEGEKQMRSWHSTSATAGPTISWPIGRVTIPSTQQLVLYSG